MENTTNKTKTVNEKRSLLVSLSKAVEPLVEMGKYDKINDAIINEFYKDGENLEFNTFKGWKEKNLIVKKGSKGFSIWSKPIKGKKKESDEEITDENGRKFFGMAYLFSNAQVEPLNVETND